MISCGSEPGVLLEKGESHVSIDISTVWEGLLRLVADYLSSPCSETVRQRRKALRKGARYWLDRPDLKAIDCMRFQSKRVIAQRIEGDENAHLVTA
jgi:hypothetical protein